MERISIFHNCFRQMINFSYEGRLAQSLLHVKSQNLKRGYNIKEVVHPIQGKMILSLGLTR